MTEFILTLTTVVQVTEERTEASCSAPGTCDCYGTRRAPEVASAAGLGEKRAAAGLASSAGRGRRGSQCALSLGEPPGARAATDGPLALRCTRVERMLSAVTVRAPVRSCSFVTARSCGHSGGLEK